MRLLVLMVVCLGLASAAPYDVQKLKSLLQRMLVEKSEEGSGEESGSGSGSGSSQERCTGKGIKSTMFAFVEDFVEDDICIEMPDKDMIEWFKTPITSTRELAPFMLPSNAKFGDKIIELLDAVMKAFEGPSPQKPSVADAAKKLMRLGAALEKILEEANDRSDRMGANLYKAVIAGSEIQELGKQRNEPGCFDRKSDDEILACALTKSSQIEKVFDAWRGFIYTKIEKLPATVELKPCRAMFTMIENGVFDYETVKGAVLRTVACMRNNLAAKKRLFEQVNEDGSFSPMELGGKVVPKLIAAMVQHQMMKEEVQGLRWAGSSTINVLGKPSLMKTLGEK